MEANSILRANLLDILFENRNKQYGAYELRKTYHKRILYAVAGTFILCILLTVAGYLPHSPHASTAPVYVTDVFHLSNVDDQPQQPVKPPPVRTVPQVATIKVTVPRIVPDHLVDPDETPPTNEQAENVRIGLETTAGTIDDAIQPLLEQTTRPGLTLKTNQENYENTFHPVEIEAQFPGGADAWINYLERNLRTEVPVENGAPAGKYTVIVSFLVDVSGNISEIKALNDPGYGTAEEAVRVIKKSKQWSPAIQNGRPVAFKQKEAITFVVTEQ